MSDGDSERCAHCGEVLGAKVIGGQGGGPRFCCVGCASVWSALREAGLGESFYRWSEVELSSASCPVPTPVAMSEVERALEQCWEVSAERVRGDGERVREVELFIEGLHCAGCVWLIEQLPMHVSGVVETRLEVGKGRLRLVWTGGREVLGAAIGWLGKFGYQVGALSSRGGRAGSDQGLLRRVGVSWALTGNVMLLSAAHYSGLDGGNDAVLWQAAQWMMAAMATVSLVYGADVFLVRAWASVRGRVAQVSAGLGEGGALSMDVPLALGIVAGWLASVYAVVSGEGKLWFDSVVMLTAALLTARLVQDRATSYARQAAARLIELLPKQVWRVGVEGELERVALDEVEAGAVVEVRAGDRFGVDGLVVSGQTRVSRAALTGESEPEVLASGDRVEAGTLNVGGPVRVRVESAGDQTRMGKLLMWVEQRAVARAPRLQLVDKMGGWFVSAVLLVAALTALMSVGLGGQELLSRVVAVLVISCPCALGMAGPIASAVFVGRAAREGIFIKHDDVLANMSELTHVIFDKTGTLTRGELTLEVMTGSLEALAWASALERGSDHVIARAVVSAADERGVASWEAEQVEEHVGCGMSGVVGGVDVRVGRASWLGVSDRDGMLGPILERGLTPVVVEVGGEVVGVLGLGDALRPESRGLVSELRARGVEVMILSGDHQAAVWRVGEQLGLERKSCVGGVSPEGKEAHILRLQSVLGAKIALIGDGVNDAAAMQAAQVGIAVHGSAEVSLLAADIFLSARGLGGLISLFDGARGLERVVRRNLVGSAIYNAVGITLASAGYVTPLLAAVFMPLSSLSVVASSLLGLSLRRVEPTKRGDYERVILVSSAGAADGDRGGRFVPVGDP